MVLNRALKGNCVACLLVPSWVNTLFRSYAPPDVLISGRATAVSFTLQPLSEGHEAFNLAAKNTPRSAGLRASPTKGPIARAI